MFLSFFEKEIESKVKKLEGIKEVNSYTYVIKLYKNKMKEINKYVILTIVRS